MDFKLHQEFSEIFSNEPFNLNDRHFYKKYEELLLNGFTANQHHSDALLSAAQQLFICIDKYAKRLATDDQNTKPFIPDISLQAAREFFTRHTAQYVLAAELSNFYAFVIGAVYSEVKNKTDIQGLDLPSDVLVHAATYDVYRSFTPDIFSLPKSTIREITENASQLAAGVAKDALDKAAIEHRKMLQIIESASNKHIVIEQATQEISSHFETLHASLGEITPRVSTINEKLQDLENQGNSIKQNINTHSTKVLWETNYNSHRSAFWCATALIAAAVLGPFLFAYCKPDTMQNIFTSATILSRTGLPENPTDAQVAAASISRIAIIAAPVFLYVWGLKLLIRFQMRSLALMDDANQRRATMDTYFHLLEHDKASTEERALMLNALFRPLPGQGNDNVDPPNYIDIVKDKVGISK